ncbi:MAG: LysE family translocator, partial [Caenispirillum sp.]|nr:LysE family translocator [Caenispirillum sp.]
VPEALSAVRLAGAAWLAWLGWRIAAAPPPPPPQARADRPKTPAVLPFRRAVLTNLLNPKALVFCSVLLPQFVDAASVTPATDFAGLGTALVAVGALFDTGYAAVGWRLGGLSQRSPRSARIQQRIAGLALVAFGLHLAAAG